VIARLYPARCSPRNGQNRRPSIALVFHCFLLTCITGGAIITGSAQLVRFSTPFAASPYNAVSGPPATPFFFVLSGIWLAQYANGSLILARPTYKIVPPIPGPDGFFFHLRAFGHGDHRRNRRDRDPAAGAAGSRRTNTIHRKSLFFPKFIREIHASRFVLGGCRSPTRFEQFSRQSSRQAGGRHCRSPRFDPLPHPPRFFSFSLGYRTRFQRFHRPNSLPLLRLSRASSKKRCAAVRFMPHLAALTSNGVPNHRPYTTELFLSFVCPQDSRRDFGDPRYGSGRAPLGLHAEINFLFLIRLRLDRTPAAFAVSL